MNPLDIIIPLGNGSRRNNAELRYLLRSIKTHASGWREIIVVTDYAPDWLAARDRLRILPYPDIYTHCKDANLFAKLQVAMMGTDAYEIVWTCDDCALLQNMDLLELPIIYNPRTLADFAAGKSKWNKRMAATLVQGGMKYGNYDTHTPQRWNCAFSLSAMKRLPWEPPSPDAEFTGLCINTAVLGYTYGDPRPQRPFIHQDLIKETAESAGYTPRFDRPLIGYNDKCADAVLAGLAERFKVPSPWEWAKI